MTWVSDCGRVRLLTGDCRETLKTLPDASVHCCVTSPPYFGLRSYNGGDAEIGIEETPDAFVANLVAVFREVRRVLRDDGCAWINLGDSYAGHNLPSWRPGNEDKNQGASNKNGVGYVHGLKPKDLIGIPWRVAFALQADGWYLRQDIIWHKPNPMPESVTDRCTKAHEYIFLLTKSARYWYDAEAVKEGAVKGGAGSSFNKGKTADHQLGRSSDAERIEDGTRNKRSVWTVATQPCAAAHFATYPPKLIEPCIMAGCPEKCCPKCGKGWERQIELQSRVNTRPGNPMKNDATRNDSETRNKRYVSTYRTIGHSPACDCGESSHVPGVTLDPFNGAGTSGLVALQQNRHYIGCELNPQYADMTRERLAAELRQGRLAL